ncbi:PREDICTED: uncharacterized protein LOC109224396 [Nicotiana attenuata]|uniref:uncharacterized protein LOC109224396 n=1 Tax=Nicotiana attenuata TaxID=49451 RepID=UPI0009049773|nr:PREDICTED: uncharacterized protein LOC109224396 [Nicotiana attenuata]
MTTVRALIATTVKKGWCISQLDVNNAFLHGDLNEKVYMQTPPGLVMDKPGLKNGDSLVYVAVYVEVVLLTGTDQEEITQLKDSLHEQFKIKDLGQLHFFLGLEEYTCLDYKSCYSPLDPTIKLKAKEGTILQDPTYYRKLAAFHMLRYQKSDPTLGIFMSKDTDCTVKAYCDSDWASCPNSKRSITGYLVLLGNSPVSWKSKKQETMSLSSAEAEYRALRKVVREMVWLSRLFEELDVPFSMPISVYCDSQSALHIAKNPVIHERPST